MLLYLTEAGAKVKIATLFVHRERILNLQRY